MAGTSKCCNFWPYGWDHDNRLVTASTRKNSVRYKYDALGRRIERNFQFGRERTRFTYDGDDVLLDDNAGTLTKYLNGDGIDNKLRATTGSNASYFLADHLGSTNGLADSTGALTSQTAFDSFGNPSNAAFTSRYQFTGREFDSFTGLQFSRARFYDPKLGRFISEDPIGLGGGDVNLFGYVHSNSINKRDPLGLIDPIVYQNPSMYSSPHAFNPRNPTLVDFFFGDGGIFSRQTFSEFVTATERSKRKCKSTWFQRFWNNVETTNSALPGFGAPSIFPGLGIGAITSGATANTLQTMTFLQWARVGFGGSVSGAASFTAVETGVGVAVGTAANAVMVTVAYEGGVGIGSAVNATFGYSAYCPCGQ